VFAGSTNDSEMISDPTGSRRFWIIDIEKISPQWIEKNRDAIWSEALHYFNAGESIWLTDEEEATLEKRNKTYTKTTDYHDEIAAIVFHVSHFKTNDVVDALGSSEGLTDFQKLAQTSALRRQVAYTLRVLDYEYKAVRFGDDVMKVWVSPSERTSEHFRNKVFAHRWRPLVDVKISEQWPGLPTDE